MKIIKRPLKFIEKTLLVSILFIILVFLLPTNFIQIDISNLLTATTVLFGILTGFFIAATLTNYFRMQSLIAEETANLISLRDVCITLEPSFRKEINDAIDRYIIASFDFELTEYIDKTWEEFNKILKITDRIKKKNTNLFASLMNTRTDLLKIRQEITLTARKIIPLSGWITIIALAIINIALLYSIRNSSIISSIFTVLLSSAACLVLFLLDEIDSDRFAEEKLAFEIYQRTFLEIGKLPYYPSVSVESGRIRPKGTYRLGEYKDYPKSLEKTIKIIKA